jgi:hypothetical protein
MKARRVVLAALGVLIGAGLTACGGSSKPTSHRLGINALLSQVRDSFGDYRLLAAFVKGPTLIVRVAAPDEPSTVSATFEAQILAAAFHDSVSASGGTPIDSVKFLDANGHEIAGYGAASVGSDTGLAPLGKGACMSAARPLQTSSLTIRSALTLPYAGGACAFRFRTPDPSSFAAGIEGAKLVNAMGDPNKRSYLVEVDNQAGVPQFVDNYTPGGGGVAYVKPGSGILFGP